MIISNGKFFYRRSIQGMLYHKSPVLCGSPKEDSQVNDDLRERLSNALLWIFPYFRASGVLFGEAGGARPMCPCTSVPKYPKYLPCADKLGNFSRLEL